MAEPEPIEVLSYAPPDATPRRRTRRTASVLTWCALAVTVIGAGLIPTVDVESVAATGPLLAACALSAIVCALVTRRPWVVALNGGHLAVCVLFAGLVNTLHWTPGRATVPFALMSAVWAILASVLTPVVLYGLERRAFTHD